MRKAPLVAIVGLGAGIGLVGSAAAAESVDYRGTFSGPIGATDCTQSFIYQDEEAGGSWRVNLHEQKATARFVITVAGEPHVAWTAQMQRVEAPGGAVFRAELPGLGAEGQGVLTITLASNGTFTYVIHPYDFSAFGWGRCASVTYSGTVS